MPAERVLPREQWHAARARHEERADELTAAHRARRAAGETHPVEDFLFTYYSFSPGQLRRWHPGVGTALDDAAEYLEFSGYERVHDGADAVSVGAAILRKRRSTVAFVADLLAATAGRPPQLGCFGLHEWAMVYRAGTGVRHSSVPLRLGDAGTDAVVESMPLRCTHYDAFRFFTPDAAPRNRTELTRGAQIDHEQPGCLHAGMDLYKWSHKLVPLIDSTLVLDCFVHARDARELDMRASPYDLRAYGYSPVPVETPGGRADYAREQLALAERGAVLRGRLSAECQRVLAYAASSH
ncbi:3-methyladenine DNA glycosylase [Rhodococcus sp. HNM0569]|nr:3-methyladenine DNA glycosylase [Rhodococcus sp. HNM0569]